MSPETRASYAHSIMDAVAKLPPVQAEAIKVRTGPSWLRIEQAPKVAWLDEATYNALTEAVRAELGDPETLALFRAVGRRVVSSPSLQAMYEAAMRLFGMSPHSVLKIVPRARQSVVRNSGTLVYERVDTRCARLRLTDFPSSTFRLGTTVIILTGTLLGCLDTLGVSEQGRVVARDVDLLAGAANFEVSW